MIDQLRARRDPRSMWDDPSEQRKISDNDAIYKTTGHMEKRGISQDYFKGSAFINKFVGADKNKNNIPDILERPFKRGTKNVKKYI